MMIFDIFIFIEMSIIKAYEQSEIKSLKILKTLEMKHYVKPIVNNNGEYSFKRHDINMNNEYQYLYAKHVKLLNIRTRLQLINLWNLYNNELFNTYVSIEDELERSNVKRIKQSTLRTYDKMLKDTFMNHAKTREQLIIKYGLKLHEIARDEYNDYYFIDVKYGQIDYYRGVILVANINANMLIQPLLAYKQACQQRGIFKQFKTNDYGILQIIYGSMIHLYDLRHPNSIISIWYKNGMVRLYINNDHNIYIKLNKDKMNDGFIKTNLLK